MQAENFIKYITTPSLIATIPEKELQLLIQAFPYCQTGQLLSAIHLKTNNSILFEEQLKIAAVSCTDRSQLFKHINKQETPIEVLEGEKEISSVNKEETNTIKYKVTDTKDLDALEQNYLAEAVNSSILLESEEEIVTEKEDEVDQKENAVVESGFDTHVEHTYNDWLKHYNGDALPEVSQEMNSLTKKSKLDLIDKFIQEDPKIKPKKTEFYSPTNMARLSVVDDSDIVSETLALVYVDQGKYEEAIKAYEKLSLTNPEKRSYFVSQIKILKQKN